MGEEELEEDQFEESGCAGLGTQENQENWQIQEQKQGQMRVTARNPYILCIV